MSKIGGEKQYTLQLSNMRADHLGLVGEPVLSYAAIAGYNIEVAPAFAITSNAFDDFLTAADIVNQIVQILSQVVPGDDATANLASQQITDLIMSHTIPNILLSPLSQAVEELLSNDQGYLLLRPSWIFDDDYQPQTVDDYTIENVYGEENYFLAIKQCWASLFSAEAIMSRVESKYSGSLSTAVFVQRIIKAESTGEINSYNTEDGNEDLQLVTALFGARPREAELVYDRYLIDKKDNRILEKNVSAQPHMYLLKGRPSGGDNLYMQVPLSQAGRSNQKLADKYLRQMSKLVVEIESDLQQPVQLEFVTHAGHLYITDLTRLSLPVAPEPASKPRKTNDTEHKPDKQKSGDMDYGKLVAEVESLLNQPDLELDNETTQQHPTIDPTQGPGELVSDSVTAEQVPAKIEFPQMFSELGLEMTDPAALAWKHADAFRWHFLDNTEQMVKDRLLTEEVLHDKQKFSDKLQRLVNNFNTVLNGSKSKQLIVKFSDVTIDDYHRMQKVVGPVGVHRYMENPDVLALEYMAVKQTQRQSEVTKVITILPPVYDSEQLAEMKTVLMHNGYRRSNVRKLAVDFSTPASEVVVEELDGSNFDYAFIDIERFAKSFAHHHRVDAKIYALAIRKLKPWIKQLYKHKLGTILSVDPHQDNIESVLDLRPDILILKSLPDYQVVELMNSQELRPEELQQQPKKRGRKLKKLGFNGKFPFGS